MTFRAGDVAASVYDLTQNLLRGPEPDVLYLIERGDALDRCARERFPDRTFYRAAGAERITLTPY